MRPVSLAPYLDPVLGPYHSASEGWSVDEDARFRGSSGGVLTALAIWLHENNPDVRIVGAGPSPKDPRFTRSYVGQSESDLRAMAGSRYAPAANAALADVADVVIGKPCEASAVRQGARDEIARPTLLSFFCAGTPSQHATTALVESLGFPEGTQLTTVRYRGSGWPGGFVAESAGGRTEGTSYERSWGECLGPTVQSRCKICPDGLGNSGDIAVGDFWDTDDRGYPIFAEGGGRSAVIARTLRGQELLDDAVEAGVVVLRPIRAAEVIQVQPLQSERMKTLLGRLLGRSLAGSRIPKFRGFGLTRLAVADPIRTARYAWGSFKRSRKNRDHQ